MFGFRVFTGPPLGFSYPNRPFRLAAICISVLKNTPAYFLYDPNDVSFVRNRLSNLHLRPSLIGLPVLPNFVFAGPVFQNSFHFTETILRCGLVSFATKLFKSAFLFSLILAYYVHPFRKLCMIRFRTPPDIPIIASFVEI